MILGNSLFTLNPNGLVLFLDATNPASYPGTGLDWYDLSPEGNHCQLDATNPPDFVSGRFKFVSGSQNKAVVADDASLNFGTGDFTILHFSEHLVPGDAVGCALSKGARFDVNRAGWLVASHAGNASLYQVISDGSERIEMWFPAPGVPTFGYGFYGLMRRGGLLYSIYNGVVAPYNVTNGSQSTNQTMSVSSTDDITIGQNPVYGSYWNGNISNVIMYNRGISDAELADINKYARRFPAYKMLGHHDTLRNGMFSYYGMEGNSLDATGANNGLDNNMTYGAGKIKQGAIYSTLSDINVGPVPQLSGASQFSVAFWGNSPDLLFPLWIYKHLCIDIRYDGTYQYGVHLKVWNSALTDYATVRNSSGTMAPGAWGHVVITYNAGSIKIYINGVLCNSEIVNNGHLLAVPTTINTHTSDLLIGDNLTGTMDEVGFWNRELNAGEVTRLHGSGNGLAFPFLRTLTNHNHYLLDQFKGAAMAYSVRRLRTEYTGSALRVRRTSDDAELDIGFDWKGDLDTTALMLFVGASSGTVAVWYDQSGNGNDMYQTTDALQPLIVNAGVLITRNGRPSTFTVNGAGQYLRLPADVSIGTNYSMLGCMTFPVMNKEWIGASTSNMYGIFTFSGQVYHNASINPADTCFWLWNLPQTFPLNTQTIVRIHRSNLIASIKVNDMEPAPVTRTGTFNNNFNVYSLNSELAGFYSNSWLQETIIYNTNRSADDQEIYKNIKKYYHD